MVFEVFGMKVRKMMEYKDLNQHAIDTLLSLLNNFSLVFKASFEFNSYQDDVNVYILL